MSNDYNRNDKMLWKNRWKPKQGEPFFFINRHMMVCKDTYDKDPEDEKLMRIGNCFKHLVDAYKAQAMLKKTLKLFHCNN